MVTDMIDNNDVKDILNASARKLVHEIAQLAVLSQELSDALSKHESPDEMLKALFALQAQNSNIVLALSNIVVTHLGATGVLDTEIKLHS